MIIVKAQKLDTANREKGAYGSMEKPPDVSGT